MSRPGGVAFAVLLSGCAAMTRPQPMYGVGSTWTQPPKYFDRGVDYAFNPATLDAPPVVDFAIEARRDGTLGNDALEKAGATSIGTVDVEARHGGKSGSMTPTGKLTQLHDGVARAIAARGGTHFILLGAKDTGRYDHGYETVTRAAYLIYRVEPAAWSQLDASIRPTPVTP